MDKRSLTIEELDAEAAFELPDREMLALVVIKNLANNNRISVRVSDNNVAVQVCALVHAISALSIDKLTCRITQ
jgi:hypothetical protein